MRKTLLFCLIWFSIGCGVEGAFFRRHNKPVPEETSVALTGAILWPSMVVAELYLFLAPPLPKMVAADE